MKIRILQLCFLIFPFIFISLIVRTDTPEISDDPIKSLGKFSSTNSDNDFIDFERQNEHLKNNVVSVNSPAQINSEASANIPNIVCYKGPIPAYPSGVFGHASAILGDTLYVCGGMEDGASTNYVYRYHIPYGEWTNGRNMPFVKSGGDLVKCGNALYYIGGGTTVSSGNFITMRYRQSVGWDTVARIPAPLSGNTAECWGDSVIFSIAGGWSQFYGVIQVYRPALNTWTVIADSLPLGMGRRTHASGIVGNKILVASGFSGIYRNDLVIGTIGQNANQISWVQRDDINCRGGMSRPGGVGIDGHFYVVGAETNPAPAVQDSIFIYDVENNLWLTPVSGRGSGASSNYWGTISAQIINNSVNVYIPGGSLTGATEFGIYTARFRDCEADPIDTILVLTGDSTIGTAAQMNGRRADRDTLLKYLDILTNGYDLRFKDTSAATIPSIINGYKIIILHELASDANPVRYMGNAWRNSIKSWLSTGTPDDKRILILIGGDMGYNYGRSNSPVYDSVLSKTIGKFSYKSDNGNLPTQNKITWFDGNYSDSMTTSPIGVNFWPDGCSLIPGGTALAKYTGRTDSDSLAIIGNAPANENYVVVSIFQDPRYFTGSGGTAGNPPKDDRGFKRVLELALKWAKIKGGLIDNLNLNVSVIPEGFYDTGSGRLNSKDTVRAYLRNTSSPFSVVDYSIAVLDSVNPTASFEFNNAAPGTYYILVNHRNSIDTWSKSGGENILASVQNNYDFTTSISQAFGNNQVLKGSKYCMFSGDVIKDGFIDLTDLIAIFNNATVFTSGYINTDVNGDYITDLTDLVITHNNAVNYIETISP